MFCHLTKRLLLQLVTHFQPRDFNVVSAVKPANREKNRSTDHLPMENGRVHLTPKPGVDGSDYINATWLMGHQRLREFIITQHPLPSSTLDFWQMVWDHNAQTIVVLTAVDESQGFPQFWPAQHDDFDSEHWKASDLTLLFVNGLVQYSSHFCKGPLHSLTETTFPEMTLMKNHVIRNGSFGEGPV